MTRLLIQRAITGWYEAGTAGDKLASQYWAKVLADTVIGSNRDFTSLLTTLDDIAYSWTAPPKEDTP